MGSRLKNPEKRPTPYTACRKLRETSLQSSYSAEQNPTVTAEIGCWIREITSVAVL